MIKKLPLSAITADAGLNPRERINLEVVADYAEAMRHGAIFPALVGFFDGKKTWLAEGFHRYAATKQNGAKSVDCDVRNGSRTDAIKFALGANRTHGLRRTNADKQHAADIAVREFPNLSDSALAEMCGVSRQLISDARQRIQPANFAGSNCEIIGKSENMAPPPRRVGKDGKMRPSTIPQRKSSAPPARKSKPPETMDATGIAVPPEILALWDSAFSRSQRLLTLASEIRSEIRNAQDANDSVFRECDHMDIVAKLDTIYADLKRAKPYAVCPDCNGVSAKGCQLCKGRGFLSEFAWKNFVPTEKKRITGREDRRSGE